MTPRTTRVNNAVKAQARDYQKSHPGTTYTAAREAVLRQESPSVGVSPLEESLDRLVGQHGAKAKLRQMFAMEEVRAERDRRSDAAKWKDRTDAPPPRVRQVFPKVCVAGPPGAGSSTVVNIIHDEISRIRWDSAQDVHRHYEKVREERGEVVGGTPDIPRAVPVTTVSVSQIIGRHNGVQSVVERAEGGMLVIENIQDLTIRDDSLHRETLASLTHEIRLVAHNLAVCAIGYLAPIKSVEARDFAGLFPVTVELDSITPNDARELAQRFAPEKVEPRALDAIAEHLSELARRSEGERYPLINTLGNARFIRSVMERASTNLMARLASLDLSALSDEELNTLTVEDVSEALKARTRT